VRENIVLWPQAGSAGCAAQPNRTASVSALIVTYGNRGSNHVGARSRGHHFLGKPMFRKSLHASYRVGLILVGMLLAGAACGPVPKMDPKHAISACVQGIKAGPYWQEPQLAEHLAQASQDPTSLEWTVVIPDWVWFGRPLDFTCKLTFHDDKAKTWSGTASEGPAGRTWDISSVAR
jgi:hypothetical protein